MKTTHFQRQKPKAITIDPICVKSQVGGTYQWTGWVKKVTCIQCLKVLRKTRRIY